jgi:N-hydroxyarylamine O-acetyltransferase
MVLTTPIKLELHTVQATAHEDFRLMPIDEDIKLQVFSAGEWKTLYRFDLVEQYPIDYEVSNYHVYNHPSSHFRHKLIVTQPLPHGRQTLNDSLFSVYHADGRIEKTVLKTVPDILNILTDHFGLKLPQNNLLHDRLHSLIQSS